MLNLYVWKKDGTELINGDNNPNTNGVFGNYKCYVCLWFSFCRRHDEDGDLEIFWGSGIGRRLYAWHHTGLEVIDGDNDPTTQGVFAAFAGTEEFMNSDPVNC